MPSMARWKRPKTRKRRPGRPPPGEPRHTVSAPGSRDRTVSARGRTGAGTRSDRGRRAIGLSYRPEKDVGIGSQRRSRGSSITAEITPSAAHRFDDWREVHTNNLHRLTEHGLWLRDHNLRRLTKYHQISDHDRLISTYAGFETSCKRAKYLPDIVMWF